MDPVAPAPTETRIDPDLEVTVANQALTLSRWFDAPRERVWKAWTDPERLASWWGPHGFTNPTAIAEARPGGRLRIVMRSPDGVDYPVVGEFVEVDPPSRIVFTDTADEAPAEWRSTLDSFRTATPAGTPLRMIVTVSFEERDGGTQLTIVSEFASDDDRDAVMRMGAVSGWSESLDKLETLLRAT
jgi:uncharacterized protein YndB with AHSA1/START domain